jgi:glutamate dehydrogenase (NAD(P)+)
MTRVIEYIDPIEGCAGYLAYDREEGRLAAGGMRMVAGLTSNTLSELAARMAIKQRVLGTNVNGAKSGLAYDPRGPARKEVLARFLEFIQDELRYRYSMGSDMNTNFEELSELARGHGIPSIKYAVKNAQEISDDEFFTRLRLLNAPVGRRTVGQRRAGHVLGHCALATAESAGYQAGKLRIGMQGFGNLGRSAAETLVEHGAQIVAVSDEFGCVADPAGLDIIDMMSKDPTRPIAHPAGSRPTLPRDSLFDIPVDLLILAAAEDAVSMERTQTLPTPMVVVGANVGLSFEAEHALLDRGVLVVPDFLGGIGGSASMETLWGPEKTPEPHEVLDDVAYLIRELMSDVLYQAKLQSKSPRRIAMDIVVAAAVSPDRRAYGSSPYARRGRRPRGNRVAGARGGLVAGGAGGGGHAAGGAGGTS